ncbi:PAAR domain-containing protein [Paraburkholderia sp.]|uniref:PAAR domain-containing protein n=1 Tax=Paraburkholderia sp. TaxID=1926495 RepID=UPI0025E3562E|nr:PAAR domain-containing protein [Paraburkholderia sp.]
MPRIAEEKDVQPDSAAKPKYLFATIGARTERGGRITKATSGLTVAGLTVARVGDVVTYEDGSEAAITDGAGEYAVDNGKSMALVGSGLSNGDRIVETLQNSWGIDVPDAKGVKGLFDPAYVPPPPPRYRLAVRGSTTARGGVLCEPSGTWEVSVALGKTAVIGDLVHYPDGTTARIASGLGLADNHDYVPKAFVGSELDNGDIITDSPERNGMASSTVFVVVKRSTVNG